MDTNLLEFLKKEKSTIPCFCGSSEQGKMCHWHCPECHFVLTSSEKLKEHLSSHGLQGPEQEGNSSHELKCQEIQARNDLECLKSDEGDLEELTRLSSESMGGTLIIPPQLHSQPESKDPKRLYELFKKTSGFQGEDGCCKYCKHPVLCTLDHMKRRHFRYAILFESKDVKKITIPCHCKVGSRVKNRCHWHCSECQHVVTRATNFKNHMVLHGYEVPGYLYKAKTSREPQMMSEREVSIPWIETPDAEQEIENFSDHSDELMIMTGEIQDHMYHKNKDTKGAEVHNGLLTEDVQKQCRDTKNCQYCSDPVPCTPGHLQDRHLNNAIHFTYMGVKKFTMACFCEIGGQQKSREHWHCLECWHVVTSAEDLNTHILVSHGVEDIMTSAENLMTDVVSHGVEEIVLTHKGNPICPRRSSKRKISIPWDEIKEAKEDPDPALEKDDLLEQSAELMTMTGEIQDHVYHTNKDTQGATEGKSDSVDKADEVFPEDLEELCRGTENCKYCRHPVLCTQKHMRQQHLKNAIHYQCDGVVKFSISCFCEMGREKHRCHWHCPKCERIMTRVQRLKYHLSAKHGLKFTQKTRKANRRTVRCLGPAWNEEDLEKLIGECAETKDMSLENYQKCLSQMTQNPLGQKNVSTALPGQLPITESEESSRSLKNCKYCGNTVLCTPKHMWVRHVKFAIHFESNTVKKFTIPCSCAFEDKTESRSHWHCPQCWMILTRAQNFIGHLSRHGFKVTVKKHRKKSKSMHDSGRPRDVERQSSYPEGPEPESDEEEIGEQSTATVEFTRGIGRRHVRKMTEYLWREKRIPSELPQELSTSERDVPVGFEPGEITCPYCPGPSPPALGSRQLVTRHATVYGVSAVTKDVSVYIKKCPICRHPVRFQDYCSGFHNYNNRIFLTIPLCSMMTAGIGNHIAIGRFLETMESHLSVSLPMKNIERAFNHFSALRDYEYSYSCERCGHSPPVLIADANCKDVFDLPVCIFKRPLKGKIKAEDTEVNVQDRWETLEKRMVASALCDGTKMSNPYTSSLSYSSFTPWLGQEVRVSDTVPKTEALKGLSQKGRPPDSDTVSDIDEDDILEVLESDSPKRSDLVKACAALGVPPVGTADDLIHRLRELLLYKELYPKMFAKLKKTGGSVLCLTCPHSVVYYHSPLWWQESARDHGDALLSFRQPPTVYISDVAGRVARHVNDRTSQRYFQPYDGRICADTEENMMAAMEKSLQVRLPWVTGDGLVPVQTACADKLPGSDRFSELHPVTGTDARFSLYPRLPQKNSKLSEDLLRCVKLAPDLAAVVSPSLSEPLSRELSISRRYFRQMEEEDHYLFSVRLYFHLHNLSVNKRYQKAVQLQTPQHVTVIGVDSEQNQVAKEGSGQTVSHNPLKRKRDDS